MASYFPGLSRIVGLRLNSNFITQETNTVESNLGPGAGKWPEVAGKLPGTIQVSKVFTQATQIVGFVGPATSKRM